METDTSVNPFEKRQAVAITLAAANHDWSLARMASLAERPDEHRYYNEHAQNYRNLFNPATLFFHPCDANGNFIMPFDYRFSGGQGARDYYSENNGSLFRFTIQQECPCYRNLYCVLATGRRLLL